MANRTMSLTLSADTSNEVNGFDTTHNGQTVSFLNAIEGAHVTSPTAEPAVWDYENRDSDAIALMNFYEYSVGDGAAEIKFGNLEGMATIRSSADLSVAIYKQELGYDKNGNVIEVSDLVPVSLNQANFHLRDFNVTNNRWYRYVLYPSNKFAPLVQVQQDVRTKWNGWSITELHPMDATMKRFSVTSQDVWVFNLNVETGDQSQHMVRTEQQTLGQYPRYSQGRQNYLTGNVSCLLGRDVLPADWVLRNGTYVNVGGYQEKLPFTGQLSSNDRVDMLMAWRKLVFSHNPKLLKDRKGQSFIVTINESSNKPQDHIGIQPDVISFSWTEVQSMEGVEIIDVSLGGGGG